MRLTQILFKQHLLRHFKKHWRVQGKKVPSETAAYQALAEKNIPIYDPKAILNDEVERDVVTEILPPNWHARVCHTYKDQNVLVEGLLQAKSLTKTVEIKQGLPDSFVLLPSSKEYDTRVKKIILNSHVFDSEQVKLPKLKDPERPAWNFPRAYGISEKRRNKLIVSKLLNLIELSQENLYQDRLVFNNLSFSFPYEKDGDFIQMLLTADTLLTSLKPLKSVTKSTGSDVELTDIYPVKDTITLNNEHIYDFKNIYPISKKVLKYHPHTIFVHYNATEVKNIYEEDVTEVQKMSRSLLKAFTLAASYAKEQFGEETKDLPVPVTVQCIQTDGRIFHFGIFQLNTLNFDGKDGVKNVWFQTDHIPLFEQCAYVTGKPVLLGYNNEVFKHMLSFYRNV